VKLEHNFATDDPGSAAACMPKLTPKQRQLQREIEEIAESIGMDHWNIEKYPADARTPKLGVMKMQLIRGEIITKYTLIDEFLTVIICNYYFKNPLKTHHFDDFGKLINSKYLITTLWTTRTCFKKCA
jgi:hypothetical protein